MASMQFSTANRAVVCCRFGIDDESRPAHRTRSTRPPTRVLRRLSVRSPMTSSPEPTATKPVRGRCSHHKMKNRNAILNTQLGGRPRTDPSQSSHGPTSIWSSQLITPRRKNESCNANYVVPRRSGRAFFPRRVAGIDHPLAIKGTAAFGDSGAWLVILATNSRTTDILQQLVLIIGMHPYSSACSSRSSWRGVVEIAAYGSSQRAVSCGLYTTTSNDRRIRSRASAMLPRTPVAIACTGMLPAAVASTGPATTCGRRRRRSSGRAARSGAAADDVDRV